MPLSYLNTKFYRTLVGATGFEPVTSSL